MRIAIASLDDPRSVNTWSGIPSNIIFALMRRGHEVIPIVLERPEEPWHYAWLRRYYHRIHGKWFLSAVEERWLRLISSQLDRAVNDASPEVVCIIHGDWLAYATFNYPACIIHDTTFDSIVDYYPSFMNLSKRSLRMGNQMYRNALRKASAAVYPARWASQSAIQKYGTPQAQVFTIPFGANMDFLPDEKSVDMAIALRARDAVCNMVFLGTHWERKGGPDALRLIALLNNLGMPTNLMVIGCSPAIPPDMREYVHVVGYLKRDKPEHRDKFKSILLNAHALILLSHAECYGCAYCEANAFGLPALGRDTGGVSEIITDGQNGLLLKHDESLEAFATRWATIWQCREAYTKISVNSYSLYRQRLNYDVFADNLEQVLAGIVMKKVKI